MEPSDNLTPARSKEKRCFRQFTGTIGSSKNILVIFIKEFTSLINYFITTYNRRKNEQ